LIAVLIRRFPPCLAESEFDEGSEEDEKEEEDEEEDENDPEDSLLSSARFAPPESSLNNSLLKQFLLAPLLAAERPVPNNELLVSTTSLTAAECSRGLQETGKSAVAKINAPLTAKRLFMPLVLQNRNRSLK
jgi:hypothetical protein